MVQSGRVPLDSEMAPSLQLGQFFSQYLIAHITVLELKECRTIVLFELGSFSFFSTLKVLFTWTIYLFFFFFQLVIDCGCLAKDILNCLKLGPQEFRH